MIVEIQLSTQRMILKIFVILEYKKNVNIKRYKLKNLTGIG